MNKIFSICLLYFLICIAFGQPSKVIIQFAYVYHEYATERDNLSVNVDGKGYNFIDSTQFLDYGAFSSSYLHYSAVQNEQFNYDYYEVYRNDFTPIPIQYFGYSDRCKGNNSHFYRYTPNCYCEFGVRCRNQDDTNFDEGSILLKFWEFKNNGSLSVFYFTNNYLHGFSLKVYWEPILPNSINFKNITSTYCGKDKVLYTMNFSNNITNKLTTHAKENIEVDVCKMRLVNGVWNVMNVLFHQLKISDSFPVSNTSNQDEISVLGFRLSYNGYSSPYYIHSIPITILPNPPDSLLLSVLDPLCFNSEDGQIVIQHISGLSDNYITRLYRDSLLMSSYISYYPFNLSNSTSNIYNLKGVGSGTYVLKTYNNIRNNIGCYRIDTVVLHNPTPLVLDTFYISNYNNYAIQCPGSTTGFILSRVSGGTGAKRVYLDSILYHFENSHSLLGLREGQYTYKIVDQNNCMLIDTILSLNAPNPLQFNIQLNPIDCFNSANGSISSIPIGGVSPYSFNNGIPGLHYTIDNLDSGEYSITIKDYNNCYFDTSVVLLNPTPLTFSVQSINPATCNYSSDGSVHLFVQGGTLPYTLTTFHNDTYTDSIYFLNNLSSGNYSTFIMDSHQCKDTILYTITSLSNLQYLIYPHHEKCSTDNFGTVSFELSSGIPPYTTLLNSIIIHDSIQNVPIGWNYFIFTDALYCEYIDSVLIENTIPFTLDSIQIVSESCNNTFDGGIMPFFSGGHLPFSYYLNSKPIETDSLTELTSGGYTFSVSDTHNCQVEENIYIPLQKDISYTNQKIHYVCNDSTFLLRYKNDSINRYFDIGHHFYFNKDTLITIPQELYLYSTYSNLCFNIDTLHFLSSSTSGPVQLFVSTNVYKGDTVALIVLHPQLIDSIAIVSDLQYESDYPFYYFNADSTGDFNLYYTIYSDNCITHHYKSLHVDLLPQFSYSIPQLGYTLIQDLSVFPNPFSNCIQYSYKVSNDAIVLVKITDMVGNLFFDSINVGNQLKGQIDTTSIPAGCYVLNLITDSESIRFKLIKE